MTQPREEQGAGSRKPMRNAETGSGKREAGSGQLGAGKREAGSGKLGAGSGERDTAHLIRLRRSTRMAFLKREGTP